jgi:formyl-CoA transferase
MFASTAILAALRARDITGEGQLLDLSLLDSVAAILANVASNYLAGGIEPRRMGNAHFNIAPYEVYRARDRWFTLAALNAKQWHMLCQVVGRPEIEDDLRFATNQDRVVNRAALADVLNEVFSNQDAEVWLAELQRVGLPCGPINTIPDVYNHPQAEARRLKVALEHPTIGQLELPGIPYILSSTPAEAHRPPPLLGEHTDEILTDLLGYTAEQVATLREHGAI